MVRCLNNDEADLISYIRRSYMFVKLAGTYDGNLIIVNFEHKSDYLYSVLTGYYNGIVRLWLEIRCFLCFHCSV